VSTSIPPLSNLAQAPRELLLWRHADALPPKGRGGDSERALSARGREDARRIAAWIASHAPDALALDLVLCSTARRARETIEALAPRLPPSCELRYERALYLGGAERLADELRGAPESARRILLVAHNPGIHALALSLCSEASLAQDERLSVSYPPGVLAQLRLSRPSWSRFDQRPAELVTYLQPSDFPR
jgi:phosphohistidine phosphatase